MKPKVMVIGIDGATLKAIKPLIDKGILPNIKKLVDEGVSGTLNSTTPPYTPTAWSSFYTGTNPGKHGIYSFTRINPETKKRELASSKAIGTRKFWQVLNEAGICTGLLNLPLTYPPEEVDGFMVTGMLTPEKSNNFTYPLSLVDDLGRLDKSYIVDVSVNPAVDSKDSRVFDLLYQSLEGRRAAALHLLKSSPCDFFMTVFVTPDRIHHVFWKYIDENGHLYDTAEGEEIRKHIYRCYGFMDETIGELVGELDGESQVFLMSDHGFCEMRSEFFLNNWLAREGFFSLGGSSRWMLGPGYRKLRSGKLSKFLAGSIGGKVREKGLRKAINWAETDAYAREQGLFLNIIGREECGTIMEGDEYFEKRQQIADKLKAFTDPLTGVKLVDSITFREDVYEGPYLGMAPDIIPVLDNYSCYIHDGVLRDRILEDRTKMPFGAHDPEGIIVAYGANINKGREINGAEIIDVTPTLIHALGLPVPDHMDGKVLDEIFDAEYNKINPVMKVGTRDGTGDNTDEVYSQDEADEIQEQLRDMGYLS